MLAADVPSKIQLPFANAGTKNTIPVPSQISITPGAASYTDGFPPITFLDILAGGIPPDGADVNGVLYAITNVQRWQSAGGVFQYDSAFSTAIGGYPKGAILQSSTEDISWLCLADNNTTDPDGGSAANWAALSAYGIGAVTGLTNTNVTLTPAQYAFPVLTLAGTLTGNVQIIFPALKQKWLVLNNTTGDFTITCKTAAGTGATVPHGGMQEFYGDGTNMVPTIGDSRYAGAMPSVTVSAVANDLVCTLKAPCKLDFRNPSLPSGMMEPLAIISDLTLTVPNGALLGTTNGAAARLNLIVAYNGGTPVLCIANPTGTLNLSESDVISPTTISTGADSADVVYSASAVSANSPYKVIKGIDITEATAGVWASNPTNVFDMGANPLDGAVVTAIDTGTNLNTAGYYIAARVNTTSSGASFVTPSATYGNAFASHSAIVHAASCTVDLYYNGTTALMQQTLTFPEFGTYEVHVDVWASTYSGAYRNGLSATAKRVQR